MDIYNDGYIITHLDKTEVLISAFSPYVFGAINSEAIYIVKEDDTIFSIANTKYNDTRYWFAICEWNKLSTPFTLIIGTELKLPNFE